MQPKLRYDTIRYDTIEEFNVDSKAEYTAYSSTHSQKLKQTKQCPFNSVQVKIHEGSPEGMRGHYIATTLSKSLSFAADTVGLFLSSG